MNYYLALLTRLYRLVPRGRGLSLPTVKSAHGMDYGEWFIEREEPVRNDIVMLKKSQDPPQNAVFDLISESKELIQQTRDKIIPELHSRIEYSPTPTFE